MRGIPPMYFRWKGQVFEKHGVGNSPIFKRPYLEREPNDY